MAPTLIDGDWLLVDPDAYRTESPAVGELVVAGASHGLVVKRVAAVSSNGAVALSGDAPSADGHAHDLIVDAGSLAGRPWFRYWPLRRLGRVR
jgi:signal peptidase I